MARAEREKAHHLPDFTQAVIALQRAEHIERIHRTDNTLLAGRGDKIEVRKVIDTELRHPHYHLREVGAVDFFRGVHNAGFKILAGVEAVAYPLLCPSGASPPLITRCLRHRRFIQAGCVGKGIVKIQL